MRRVFIYAICNDVNSKLYIGLHTGSDLRKRWKSHLYAVRSGMGSVLGNAMRKYGIENFHIMPLWSGHVPLN